MQYTDVLQLQPSKPHLPICRTCWLPAQSMSRPSDNNYLMYTVDLLARVRWDELQKAEGWSGSSLQLGLFRLIRTQRFIDFTGGCGVFWCYRYFGCRLKCRPCEAKHALQHRVWVWVGVCVCG